MAKDLPMREALVVESKTTVGIQAKMLLDWALNSASREWLDYLLDTYKDHVIEFSAFDCCWGTVPRQNAVWWEVRKYIWLFMTLFTI
jgi:hypothetical protein